jgi:deoxyhypusine monooxygenase
VPYRLSYGYADCFSLKDDELYANTHNVPKQIKYARDTLKHHFCIHTKEKAVYFLKKLSTAEAIAVMIEILCKKKGVPPAIRQEIANALGLIGTVANCGTTLSRILEDETDNLLVRFECARSLGVIGDQSFLKVLNDFSGDSKQHVAETCTVAAEFINWKLNVNKEDVPLTSLDPAPPFPVHNKTSDELQEILLNTNETLFNRLRALVSLRNLATEESALKLLEGFKDKSSVIFRVELALAVGQMHVYDESVYARLSYNIKNDEFNCIVICEIDQALRSIEGF